MNVHQVLTADLFGSSWSEVSVPSQVISETAAAGTLWTEGKVAVQYTVYDSSLETYLTPRQWRHLDRHLAQGLRVGAASVARAGWKNYLASRRPDSCLDPLGRRVR
jgi:hypothetical protein